MIRLPSETYFCAEINGECNGIGTNTWEQAVQMVARNTKGGKARIFRITEEVFCLTPEEAKTGIVSITPEPVKPSVPTTDKLPQVIVCAAIRKSGHIIAGARHFDSIMRAQIKAMNETFGDWEQGFIDQYDVFLTRDEAWLIADKQGQIRRPYGLEREYTPRPANVGDTGMMFSENLY